MRLRKCKVCGIVFEGDKEQHLCPTCRTQAKRDSVIRPRTCVQCGTVFDGGPSARYCQSCRAERVKAQTRDYHRRKTVGNTRLLGSNDICEACGKEYIVESGKQKYCPDCARDVIRANVLEKKRALYPEIKEEHAARKKKLSENGAVCAYCGRVYTSTSSSVTCSDECAREYARIVQQKADYKRGHRKNPPSNNGDSTGLPQPKLTGVNYHRTSGKWQVTHHGKYSGLFATREEAEAKKRELEQND